MAAPKKRDEFLDSSARKNRAFDADNLTVRAFKLSPNQSDEEDGSTENSSNDGSERQVAMTELRDQWATFTQRIMDVEIPQRMGPMRC